MSQIRSGDGFESLVEMSFNKLDESTRAALLSLARLAPAPNTFSEDAAMAIGIGRLEQLQNLCRQGLIKNASAGRYSLSAPVWEILQQHPCPPESEHRIASYFAHYADVFQAQTTVIQKEYDNIFRGMEAARHSGHPEEFLTIIVSLSRALDLRGEYGKWRDLLAEALSNPPDQADKHLQAIASMHLARLELKTGDLSSAEKHARRSLESDAGPEVHVDALITLGHVLLDRGELENARAHLTKALELARANEAPGAARQAAVILGVVLTRLGAYEQAAFITAAAMQDAKAAGDLAVCASLATNLGVIYFHQGRFQEAIEADDGGLAVARQIGFREKEAALLQAKGGALVASGKADSALPLLAEALEIANTLGHRWYMATILKEQGEALLSLSRIDESAERFRLTLSAGPGEAEDLRGYAHWGLARCYLEKGEYPAAIAEAEESLQIFGKMNHHLAPAVRIWLANVQAKTER